MTRPSRPRSHRARPRVESLERKQLLATFLVTSVADSGPGSLRQAILDADAAGDPGGVVGTGITAEVIDFAIPGSGVQTIAPLTPLPTIDQPTEVDATTQPGYTGSPLVVLDGLNAVAPDGRPVIGLDFTTGNDALGTGVAGLGIVRFSGSAIETDSAGGVFSGVVIGTDVAGGQNLGNGGYGIKFGFEGGNVVKDSVIENSALRAIGSDNDVPSNPVPRETFSGGTEYTTQNVEEANNDTKATELVVATPAGFVTNLSTGYDDNITLTYTITNTGPIAATDVSVELDQNAFYHLLTIVSVTSTQGTIGDESSNDGNYPAIANLGTLAPGASATLTVTANVGTQLDFPGGFGQLTAIATSPQLDYTPYQTEAYYDINAYGPPPTPLTVSTTNGDVFDEYAQWGSVVSLTYVFTNVGTTPITDVTVGVAQALFSHLLTLISATTSQGTVGTNLNLDNADQAFASLGTIAPGASATLTITAQVGPAEADDTEGDIIAATASSPDLTTTVQQEMAVYTIIPISPLLPPSPVIAPTPVNLPAVPITGTLVGTGTGTPVATTTDDIPAIPLDPSADLAISATGPASSRVGEAALFTLTVKDNGTRDAVDARVALDLTGFPAGSFYAVLSRESTGGSGRLVPLFGRPNVYLVDLDSIAAGASATIAIMVIPSTAGPIGLLGAVSDAANPTPDLNPGDNVTYVSSVVTSAVEIAGIALMAPNVIQLDLDTTVTRAQAQNVANYQLEASGAGSKPATTVKLRSASYNTADHRVTLRLAHPLPVSASLLRVSITGLRTPADVTTTTLSLARTKRRA